MGEGERAVGFTTSNRQLENSPSPNLSQRERDKFALFLPEVPKGEGAVVLPVVAVLWILVHGDADFVAHHLVEIVYGVLHVAGDGAL